MMCILNQKSVKKTSAGEERDSAYPCRTFLLALTELMLAVICISFSVWLILYGQNENYGPAEKQISIFINSSDPSAVFGEMVTQEAAGNATSPSSKQSKVSVSVDFPNTTSWLHVNMNFVYIYVIASTCLLMGLSLLVMEAGKFFSILSKKQISPYPICIDGGVYREICLDMDDNIKKENFGHKY